MKISVSAKELKDTVVGTPWGVQGPVQRLHCCFLTVPHLSQHPLPPWLATVWTCSLELRRGHGGWTRQFPVIKKWRAGAPQDPVQFHHYKLILTSISSFFIIFILFFKEDFQTVQASGLRTPKGPRNELHSCEHRPPRQTLGKASSSLFLDTATPAALTSNPGLLLPSVVWPSSFRVTPRKARSQHCPLHPASPLCHSATGRIHLCKLTLWDLAEVQTRKPIRVYYVTTN